MPKPVTVQDLVATPSTTTTKVPHKFPQNGNRLDGIPASESDTTPAQPKAPSIPTEKITVKARAFGNTEYKRIEINEEIVNAAVPASSPSLMELLKLRGENKITTEDFNKMLETISKCVPANREDLVADFGSDGRGDEIIIEDRVLNIAGAAYTPETKEKKEIKGKKETKEKRGTKEKKGTKEMETKKE